MENEYGINCKVGLSNLPALSKKSWSEDKKGDREKILTKSWNLKAEVKDRKPLFTSN